MVMIAGASLRVDIGLPLSTADGKQRIGVDTVIDLGLLDDPEGMSLRLERALTEAKAAILACFRDQFVPQLASKSKADPQNHEPRDSLAPNQMPPSTKMVGTHAEWPFPPWSDAVVAMADYLRDRAGIVPRRVILPHSPNDQAIFTQFYGLPVSMGFSDDLPRFEISIDYRPEDDE